MVKLAVMLAVIGAGLFLGVHETSNNSVQLINSAEASVAVPAPGIFALLGIGGLAMAFGLKPKK